MLVDVQDVGAGGAGGDGQVPALAVAEPFGDLLLVGGGVLVAVGGGGDLLAGQAGEDGPAAAGVGQGLAEGGVGHDVLPEVGQGVAAAGGFGGQLGGQGGQDAGLVFGLGRQGPRGAFGLEVQDGPQVGQDVQAVQAQVVRAPAGGEGGGQVAVAGAVDLLDPGLEAGDGFGPVGGRELPPRRRRARAVAVWVGVGGVWASLSRAAWCSRRVSPMPVTSSVSWVSWSWWSASCCSAAVIGSSVMVSSRGGRGRRRGSIRRARGRGCRVAAARRPGTGRARRLALRGGGRGGGRGGRRGSSRRGAGGR